MKLAMPKPTFLCEHCATSVAYDARVCPGCKRIFSGVRCPDCDFRAPGRLFLQGCPNCGYATQGGDNLLQAATFEIFSLTSVVTDGAHSADFQRKLRRQRQRQRLHRLHWPSLNYHYLIAILIGLILLAAVIYVLL